MEGPPPPPPHGANPNTTEGHTGYRKSTDLPEGNYDIFIIPPHSSGSGFLYLPSLQCHRNSFIAGSLSTLFVVFVWITILPTVKSWFATTVASGGMGIIVLVIGVGAAGWFFGASQAEDFGGRGPKGGRRPGAFGNGAQNHTGSTYDGHFPGAQQPGSNYNHSGGTNAPPPFGNTHGARPTNSTHDSSTGNTGTNNADNAKNTQSKWEQARDETARKEEIRRKMEEYKKKREAEELEKKKQREKETREREFRERKERLQKEAAAAKTAKEEEAKKADLAAKIQHAKEVAAERLAAMKEAKDASNGSRTAPPSPKKPPPPTARTAAEDDAYSFRPYDRPRRPYGTSAPSEYSESSYAPSHSTARTTPPPSNRGPYHTKDPDKVIIRGVYAFNNAFMRTPIAQLVSGQGSVTDGLILRITTEGLFIDDDVRGIAQREWDVKAWTMKAVEVWCPFSRDRSNPSKPSLFRRAVPHSTASSEESDAFLGELSKICQDTCRLGSASGIASGNGSHIDQDNVRSQTVELHGLHVVRASLRDQEGKKYVFILENTEAWKVTIGLQRLRKGSQVRALGIAGLPANEGKAILSSLGYT